MSIVNKILKEAFGKPTEEQLEEISTPTLDMDLDLPSYEYDTPNEKEQKKKKAAREKEYREEGRYDGLY